MDRETRAGRIVPVLCLLLVLANVKAFWVVAPRSSPAMWPRTPAAATLGKCYISYSRADLRMRRSTRCAAVAATADVPEQHQVPLDGVTTNDRTDGRAALKQRLYVGSFIMLWYVFNVGYNIYNKKALNVLPLPWLVGLVQLSFGLTYVIPLWLTGIRKAPVVSMKNVKNLLPVAVAHALAHITAVIALGAGAVSFTHIVKAAEPAFTALFSAVFLKQFFPLPVYLTLLPVMGGVAVASATERNFSWLAFQAAMLANTSSAARALLAKKTMKEPQGSNMGAANLYAVLTILASLVMLPVALLLEGGRAHLAWDAAVQAVGRSTVVKHTLLSGLFFYLYNEVAFLALDQVHPVTHATANTIKRVVIIATSILVFKNPVTMQGYVGSGIAIAGVFLYSLALERSKRGSRKA